jgi:hypothetical protein
MRDQHWRVTRDIQGRITSAVFVESPNLFVSRDVKQLGFNYDVRLRPIRIQEYELRNDGTRDQTEVSRIFWRNADQPERRVREKYQVDGSIIFSETERYQYEKERLHTIDVERGEQDYALHRYTYDERGLLTHVEKTLTRDEDEVPPLAERVYEYDALQRRVGESYLRRGKPEYRIIHAYDSMGNRIRTRYQDLLTPQHSTDTFWVYGDHGIQRQTIHYFELGFSYYDAFDALGNLRRRVVVDNEEPQSMLKFNRTGDVVSETILAGDESVDRVFRFSHNDAGGITRVSVYVDDLKVHDWSAEGDPAGLFGWMGPGSVEGLGRAAAPSE